MPQPRPARRLMGEHLHPMECAQSPNVQGGISSLAPAPLDLADGQGQRSVAIPLFAQLPDFSFALWDWTAGNESCPPAGTSSGPELCHEFEGHLSWLNASHFLPQAGAVFARLHGEALASASACARMPQTVETLPLRQACDREALLIEAVAHHFLQDAWSMGHMWQRWGSPAVGDFQSQLGGAVWRLSQKPSASPAASSTERRRSAAVTMPSVRQGRASSCAVTTAWHRARAICSGPAFATTEASTSSCCRCSRARRRPNERSTWHRRAALVKRARSPRCWCRPMRGVGPVWGSGPRTGGDVPRMPP